MIELVVVGIVPLNQSVLSLVKYHPEHEGVWGTSQIVLMWRELLREPVLRELCGPMGRVMP